MGFCIIEVISKFVADSFLKVNIEIQRKAGLEGDISRVGASWELRGGGEGVTMSRGMIDTPIHVIDFEGSRQSGVVEYGIATVRGGQITAAYSRLCAPIGTISDRDRAQHGISEAAARREAPFHEEWALMSRLRGEGLFCAHHMAVEAGLLQAVWPCPGRVPDFAEPGEWTADWGPWLDTLQLYRRVYPGLESYKLGDLIELFQLSTALDAQAQLLCPPTRRQYHCALYDALASALLLTRLFEENELASASLRWLVQQSAASAGKRQAMEQQELF